MYIVKGTRYVLLISTSPKISVLFALPTAAFLVTGHFETSALNNPKMTLNFTSSNIPNACATAYQCHRIPNFTPFCSTAILRKVHLWLQNDLKPDKVKCTPYVLLVFVIPNFHCVLLYDQQFSRYRLFWDKCTEWPQNDLEPYKVKLPYTCICITTLRESQISLQFALRPSVLKLQAILRQVHRMTPKWPWRLQGQRYTTYELLASPSPKFCPFCSTPSGFHDIALFIIPQLTPQHRMESSKTGFSLLFYLLFI